MNTPFLTRSRAEAWRSSQRTPAPAQLTAFLTAYPRVLPQPPAPKEYLSPITYKLGLYLGGAVLLGLLGTLRALL